MTTARLAAVALLASALLPATALAEDEVRLVRKDKAGSAWSFEETYETRLKTEMGPAGKPPETTETIQRYVRRGTLTVLAVDAEGLATSVKVAYDKTSTDLESEDPKAAPEPFFLAGKTVTISRAEDGSLKHDHAGELPEDVESELDDLLPPYATILPEGPVKPGAEWTLSKETVEAMFDLDEGEKATVRCRLVGVKDHAGRRAAEIHVVVELAHDDEGVKMGSKYEAPTLIDLESGREIETTAKGTLTMSGKQAGEGEDGKPTEVRVSGSGTIEGRQKMLPVAAAPR